jgi:transposase InsO family protein
LVRRDFARDSPDKLWMTDITKHPTREGKAYCCVVLDAFSRFVVGWSIDSTQTTTLVLNALGMAIRRRNGQDDLVIHSDRGVQFTSWAFSQNVRDAGIAPSMGAVGSPYDNAMVESFWGRMQVELLNRKTWKPGSNSRPPSTTTSSCSTTPDADTAPSECSPQPNTRPSPPSSTKPPDSRTPTPRNQGQITPSPATEQAIER